ncbi:MAG: amino acid permease [Bacteroidetes bacterium]|nr:amino acid permease [Bacteroidota bacterium]
MGELERALRTGDLTLLVVGLVIGSGIFLVPGVVLQQVGGYAGLALVVWIAGGLLSLLGALTYGELSVRHPQAGGLYAHLRRAFGPLVAFLYGWTLLLAIASGALATLAVAFGEYLAHLVPLGALGQKVAAAGLILCVTAVNVRGVRHGARLQNGTTLFKIASLLGLSLLLLWLSEGSGLREQRAQWWPATWDPAWLSGAGLGLIGVLWAYEGWQYGTFSAGEVRNPRCAFPRAFSVGLLVLIALYSLANLAYLAALGSARMGGSVSVAAEAVSHVWSPAAGRWVALAILVSILGAANGLVLTASRVYYAMARDGLLFAWLGWVHVRYRTPVPALLVSSAWSLLLALLGTFETLLTYVVFSGWLFYGLGALSLFAYRRRDRSKPSEAVYRVPVYPWTPVLFALAALGIVLNTLLARPAQGAVGLLIVATGLPVYGLWRWRARRVAASAEPEASR